ncbi:LptF/LptG family permease [Nonlabens ulvanivorans]|uniref:LptF/LptG family permease n=1 Tax=Nonlabens ulvanivorans TaxID=906888 RepID=UPI002943A50F|nr:LptF/LptG family permease [Nonlabens ulvanivorans]WOI23999.1 LptF/LptG family permease [Nonlabens ulvanivorans]
MTSFIKTFLSVFIVIMFILILQAIWLYIKDLAGKDLDMITIAKFMMYTIPVIVPLALPLSIILASIMVFGNMAENYEFAAMKSNGISLQRAMRSLIIVVGTLGVTSFFFANTVIPWGHFKQGNLRRNIVNSKPAMAIGVGNFNQLGDINIKVDQKTGDRGQFLDNVLIHKKNPKRNGNYTVIKSRKGELKSSLKSNIIQLVLTDGNYYDDLFPENAQKRRSSPFVRSYFDTYTLNVDVSGLNNVDLNKADVTDNHRMLKIHELQTSIDSFTTKFNDNLSFYHEAQHRKWAPELMKSRITDTIKAGKITDNFISELKIYDQRRTIENTINKLKQQRSSLKNRLFQLSEESKRIAKHEIEIQKKFVLGAACIILFFIGAPLGAIIRKGGMGLPLVIATLFFLTYHFINIFAEKAAVEGAFPTWIGAWMGTLIIFPLGILLTYRATTDQGFFDLGSAVESLFSKFKKKPKNPTRAV